MPRPPGPNNRRDSTVLAVRVPNKVADAVYTLAGSRNAAEWLRLTIQQALNKTPLAPGTATTAGYIEGKRQGWAHANKVFREALDVAAEKLK
jgi:hypothetical protein